MQQSLVKLDWDSDFFNFNVGRIVGPIQNEQDIKNIEGLIEENNIELAYYSTSNELNSNFSESQKIEVVPVDKKTTYIKNTDVGLEIHRSISSIDQNTPHKDKLIELAIQSGVYSRFNVDQRIGNDKFEEMYTLWMINSLNRNIAREVLAFTENDELSGFVTLGEKNNRAGIGIIAVDHDHRGKGIGKTLMASAEKWSSDSGYGLIQVVTQGDNIPACLLYEGCGYQIETVEYFYHIWRR